MLEKVLRRSDAVDKESLCIQAGQRVRPFLPPWLIGLANGQFRIQDGAVAFDLDVQATDFSS